MMNKKWIACFLCLALVLSCLAGCSSKKETPAEPEETITAETETGSEENAPQEEATEQAEEPQQSEEQPQSEEPAATQEQPQQTASAEQPKTETPAVQQPAENEPSPAPAQTTVPAEETPSPAPAEETPAPAEEPAQGIPDGTYSIDIGFSGGTGKARIQSPVTLYVKGGTYTAKVVWTSVNYDYMKVNGTKYNNENNGGNSTFTIPVPALDTYFTVIGDTVAMSSPHEIEYTLYFDSTTIR